ncbi:Putative uncharacterized protein [Lactococcus lactis subsp. lactis A12]|uniref:Uncharacterized protein n=1 Tax=Lactococcus lactis subsp. lactis A12 TaxID=1137134 RepID=S6FGF1_LACLL|nr:Putative uncharacterized protein [Lactococcus lactis subsp. lactis A12]SBW29461.1 Hypothetical protein LLA12_00286 [Lactococcus lactis subsp. lactis]
MIVIAKNSKHELLGKERAFARDL